MLSDSFCINFAAPLKLCNIPIGLPGSQACSARQRLLIAAEATRCAEVEIHELGQARTQERRMPYAMLGDCTLWGLNLFPRLRASGFSPGNKRRTSVFV